MKRMMRIKNLTLILPFLTFYIVSCSDNPTQNGELRTYYGDSTLKRVAHYKEGLLYGDEKVYYPGGNIKIKRQRKNDTLIYEQHEYYDSLQAYVYALGPGDTVISEGPTMKSYSFVNEIGEIAYQVDFDKDGKAVGYFGKPVVSVFMDSIPDKTNTKYKIIYRIATPPFFEKRELKVLISKDEEIIDSSLLEIDTKYNISSYTLKPKEAGDYIFTAIYSQQGRKNASIDTIYTKLEVK